MAKRSREKTPEGADAPDAGKSPTQLEREIDVTRERLDHSLDELGERLSPGQLLDQALAYARSTGAPAGARTFGVNLGRTVRDNPLPVCLTATGIVWLAAASRGDAHSTGVGDRPGIGARAEHTKEAVGESAHRAGERLQEGASALSRQARRTRGAWERLLEEEPLVIGLAGLAVGALAGASLPRTDSEDALFGEARDEAVATAAQRGHDVAEKARESAEETAREPGRQPMRVERGAPSGSSAAG